jgi:hypothetical protein
MLFVEYIKLMSCDEPEETSSLIIKCDIIIEFVGLYCYIEEHQDTDEQIEMIENLLSILTNLFLDDSVHTLRTLLEEKFQILKFIGY